LGLPTREELLARAKWMRANPTEAEKRLWSIVRAKRFAGYKFKRQLVIYPYIVDFACLAERLIVEADGSQHADNRDDARRDAFLRGQGFRVLRFWNNAVLGDCEAVAAAIYGHLTVPLPSPPAAALPLKGERGPIMPPGQDLWNAGGIPHPRSTFNPAEGRGISGVIHG
jgi:very-short-patch-repair endonuclease